ncbi:aminopeptidase n [Lasius niger]|uniref:Aminopeptidase n n=1 Tax=Lasius niger TaxID=67767 RepID=A0A0J7KJM4_LASNI|nr:aminopeptidase n [Lasius niger]
MMQFLVLFNSTIGYYRVNYDSSNWQKIANYLKSDNYTKIHVLNRAQIIDDAYHLMVANQLDILTFLDLISYLSQETDFIAWYPMFEILEITEDFYKFPGTEFFKTYILEILNGLVKNVGYEEDPAEDDLTKFKRSQALKWACSFGLSECKRMATVKLNEHFADPKTHKKYDMNDALGDIIDNVHSNEQLDKISKFVKNKFKEEVYKDVQGKVKERKSELSDIFAIFRLPIIEERK